MHNRTTNSEGRSGEIVAGALGFFFGIAVGIMLMSVAQISPALWLSMAVVAQSLAAGIGGAVIAFLALEWIVRHRAETAAETAPLTRDQLITQMRSHEPVEAMAALEAMRRRGWLRDGSLKHCNLTGAQLPGAALEHSDLEEASLIAANLQGAALEKSNLRGANLSLAQVQQTNLAGADLRGATLRMAYLQGADLRGAQIAERALAEAFALRGATLPDGSLYDGRFNLAGDVERAAADGIDTGDASAMQRWYEQANPPDDLSASRPIGSTHDHPLY